MWFWHMGLWSECGMSFELWFEILDNSWRHYLCLPACFAVNCLCLSHLWSWVKQICHVQLFVKINRSLWSVAWFVEMLWGDLDIWSGSIGLREGPEIWHKWKFDFKKHPNKDWWTLNEEVDRLTGIEVDRMNVGLLL
jgi:hypothetical protein